MNLKIEVREERTKTGKQYRGYVLDADRQNAELWHGPAQDTASDARADAQDKAAEIRSRN